MSSKLGKQDSFISSHLFPRPGVSQLEKSRVILLEAPLKWDGIQKQLDKILTKQSLFIHNPASSPRPSLSVHTMYVGKQASIALASHVFWQAISFPWVSFLTCTMGTLA